MHKDNWTLLILLVCIKYSATEESCKSDDNCVDGKECVAGVCELKCVSEKDCGEESGFKCVFAQCVRSCDSADDCATNQICRNELCTLPCVDKDGCPCPGLRNSICFGGSCLYRCAGDDECPDGLECVNGVCLMASSCSVDPSVCDETGLDCVRFSFCGLPCDSDKPCPSTHSCDNDTGLCLSVTEERCGEDRPSFDCGCGAYCRDNTCHNLEKIEHKCDDNNPCGIYQVCNFESSLCKCIRSSEGTCLPPPPRCDYSYDTCRAYAEGSVCDKYSRICTCPGGAIVGGKCYTDKERHTAALSDNEVSVAFFGLSSGCHPDGVTCADSSLCKSNICHSYCYAGTENLCSEGLMCYEQLCTVECWRNEECGYAQLCVNGKCVQMCSAEADTCDNVLSTCDSYRCRVTCSLGSDCDVDSKCVPSIGCITTCAQDDHCVPGKEICVSGVCSKVCRADTDCSTAATCINGRCYIKCEKDVNCGGGQRCNIGLCMLSCQTTPECNSAEICAYGRCRIRCHTNDDCAAAPLQQCFAGLCSFSCSLNNPGEGDRSCDPGDDCIERHGVQGCVPTCATTCNEVQICDGIYCFEIYLHACTSNIECEPFYYCDKEMEAAEGQCQPLVRVNSACHDGTCGTNEVCVHGVCRCAKYNSGDCLGPHSKCPNPEETLMTCAEEVAGAICNADTGMCECQGEEVQIGRRCFESFLCVQDSDCPDGSCVSFHCYSECGSERPCVDQMICVNGLCSANCTGDAHCDYNQECIKGKCVTKCQSAGDEVCADNQDCDVTTNTCRRKCTEGEDCPDHKGQAGRCLDGLCAALCISNTDCGANEICDDANVCIQTCVHDSNCDADSHCIAGLCTKQCQIKADCRPDHDCQKGLCFHICKKNDDCASKPSSVCFSGVCMVTCTEESSTCGGAICAEGLCSALCSTDEQCGAAKCDTTTHICYVECETIADCAPGQHCGGDSTCESIEGLDCSNDGQVCGGEYYCKTDGATCEAIFKSGELCMMSSDCGPAEYCNSKSRCECVHDTEEDCLEEKKCDADADCKGTMGSQGSCHTEHGYCVCMENFRLLPNGKCGIDTKTCMKDYECPEGLVCYDMRCVASCTSDDVCGSAAICTNGHCSPACETANDCLSSSTHACLGGACIAMCSTTLMEASPCVEGILSAYCGSCSDGWECEKGYCIFKCNDQCAENQKCIDGKCRCDSEYNCPGSSIAGNVGDFTCDNDKECHSIEYCQYGRCTCQFGAVRNSDGTCLWDLDRVCFNCPSCVGSCQGANQMCNKVSRLCVCAEGFTLDTTGVSCSKVSGITTNKSCRSQGDCTGYPGTVCSVAAGKCVCRDGFCYGDNGCALDTNECTTGGTAETCDGDEEMICVNTPCRENPECVESVYAAGIAVIGVKDPMESCISTLDCRRYRSKTCVLQRCGLPFCYNHKCTCERGSLVTTNSEGKSMCKVVRCTRNTECSDDTYCSDSGVCIVIPPDKIVRAGAAQQEEKLSNGLLAIMLAAALLGVLLLMLGAFLIVRKCTKSKAQKQREYWIQLEARLNAEEAELDRMEKEYELERERRREEYGQKLAAQREAQEKEKQAREEKERLQREKEEKELAEQAKKEKAMRLRIEKEEKEAIEKENQLKADAKKKAQEARKAKMEAEKAQLEAEAKEKRKQIEDARKEREEEEARKIKEQQEAEERAKKQQEEDEQREMEAQAARRAELKKKQEKDRKAAAKAQKDKIDKLKQRELDERKRIMALKKSTAFEEEEDEEEMDVAESGWSKMPNLAPAADKGKGKGKKK